MRIIIRATLFSGILSLMLGMWAGLEKLEWMARESFSSFPSHHGPFMVSGFLGTVISLERAAALGAAWSYLAPVASGIGSLLLALGLSPVLGAGLISASSLLFTVASIALLGRAAATPNIFLAFAALLWLAGNLVWLLSGWSYAVIGLWIGFLLFTIVAERLELARFAAAKSKAGVGFVYGSLCLYVVASGFASDSLFAVRIAGLCLAANALWLMQYDIARRNFGQPGLPGFIAKNLLAGYAWLLVSGLLMAAFPSNESGFWYDAALHAFFVGFVMSMIFAHAPIIFPSVAGVQVPFANRFYFHTALLSAGLLVRVAADAASSLAARKWAGLLNVAAILIFLLNTILSALGKNHKADG